MKLVLIEWEDAYTDHGWRSDDEVDGLHTARTVTCGFLKKETEGYVAVILNQGRGVYSDAITIPKGCIKRMRRLRVSG